MTHAQSSSKIHCQGNSTGKAKSFFNRVVRRKNPGEGVAIRTHQPNTLCGPGLNMDPNKPEKWANSLEKGQY